MQNQTAPVDDADRPALRKRVLALEHQLLEMEFEDQQLRSELHRLRVDAAAAEAKVTQLEALIAEMNESRHGFRKLFQLAPVAYLRVCPDGRIRQSNMAGARMLNRSSPMLHNTPLRQFIDPADHARFEQHMAAVTNSGFALEVEVNLLARNGSPRPIMILTSGAITGAESGMQYQMVLIDIARHRKTEQHLRKAKDFLERLAHHDPLTGLPNRMMFFDRLRHAMARCQIPQRKLAVLLFDVDGFKAINDTLGHAAGDRLLCEIANRSRALMRGDDTIARLGGDEFTVVLENLTDVDSALQLADRLGAAIHEPIVLGTQTVRVSSSIGVSVFPDLGTTAEELVKGADTAMYRSKSGGRNRVSLFCSELNEDSARRATLETGFTDAALQGQFELVYQPIIHADSGRISHVEALIRWHHPRLGLVMPAEFIPLLAHTGQIVELGGLVLELACYQGSQWMMEGLSVPIAINVSARQLVDPDFQATVAAALGRHGLNARRIELELTESEIMLDREKSEKALQNLHALGIPITIDDFGTGHSSLARLQALPVSRIKIDRSFTQDVGRCTNAQAIVKAILSMAHHLDLDVVAEGIENAAQRDFLQAAGSDKLQGFLISRPLSGCAITELLRRTESPYTASPSPRQQTTVR